MQIFTNPLIALVVPGLLLGVGAVSSMTDQSRGDRQSLVRNAAQQQVMAGLESKQQQAESALAISRYNGVCIWLDQGQVAEGLAIAAADGAALAEGSAVCDSFGGTAVVKGGMLTAIARTNDQNAIRKFLGW